MQTLTQTAPDGRTRTFQFAHAASCVILNVDIRDAAGKAVGEDLSYHFTDAEFEQFRTLVEAARP